MSETQTKTAGEAQSRSRGPSRWQLVTLVVILGGGVLLTMLTSDVTKVSEPGIVLDEHRHPVLAERAGDWSGGPQEGLSQDELNILPKDTEGARRLYQDQQGHQLYCSVVLAGAEVTSIHRPEVCLPGQGWTIQTENIESLPVASAPGGVLKVMRMNTVRAGAAPATGANRGTQTRSIFIYWFVGKDRTTPSHFERVFWTVRDRVFHNTNHRWAYVLIHARVADRDSGPEPDLPSQQTMRDITRFVQDLYPELVVHG